jgi:hypothetical protein
MQYFDVDRNSSLLGPVWTMPVQLIFAVATR